MAPRMGGGAKRGDGAKGGGGGADGGDGLPPHEKKTLATKQNVKFIYFNCHLLLYLPGGSVS